MNKITEITELVKELNKYRDAYYNNNVSLISDKEYDDKFDKLQELEKETGIILSASPTISVGYEVKSSLEKVEHSHLMLSLNKTKDINELVQFAGKEDCIFSLKMDGLTCLLTYNNGVLIQAETRGDGEVGELITHNAKVFENIPLTIPYKDYIEIEGEAIITYDDFEKINKDKKYKNPRNLVSGSVRQLDSSIAKKRHIKFIAWRVLSKFHYYSDGLKFVEELGFDVVPFFIYSNKKNIKEIIQTLKNEASKLSYPIDGLVMTYNNVKYGHSLGFTSHHPKHSIAYKFYDDTYETKLIDILWSMGRTGQISPVALFEKINIDGTEISRASLSNISIMHQTLGPHPFKGQIIEVSKRNQIIPKIERAKNENGEWIVNT